jgi:hypothetical protein
MTIAELRDRLTRALRAGTLSEDDQVMVRDLTVSEAAMSAGSKGYREADELLIIGENGQGMEPGVYFNLEEW